MSALSSLLVQDKIVSVSTIEEALQRQVIFGGQLDTNLLELRAVDEQLLVEYKARVNGMPPASREEIDGADLQVVRTVPAELAVKHGIVPLRFLKDALRVAVSSPAAELRLGDAASAIGVALQPVMTSELRLRVALSKYYGVELPSRFSRLAGLLAASPPRVQSRRVSRPPPAQQAPRRVEAGPSQLDHRAAPSRGAPDRPIAAAFAADADAARDGQVDVRDTHPGAAPFGAPSPPQASILPLPTGLELIERATTREEVFDAALRVVGGMVDYAACFVVKRGAAFGKAAWGRGTAGAELVRRPVLLEKPGALWAVLQTKAHYLGPLPPSRANDSLLEAIGRSRPATVLVVPVVLRNRVVVLLYADSGSRRAIGYELAALLPLASAMATTFERLIIEKKQTSLFPSVPPPAGFETQVLSGPLTSRTSLNEYLKEAPPLTPVPEPRDAFQSEASDSGAIFSDRYSFTFDRAAGRRPSNPPPADQDSRRSSSGSDTFLSDSSGLDQPPSSDRLSAASSDPFLSEPSGLGRPPSSDRLAVSRDGVLILLTEVLNDPQERRWESRDDVVPASEAPSARAVEPRASPRPVAAERVQPVDDEEVASPRAEASGAPLASVAERLARIKARGRPRGSRLRVEAQERPRFEKDRRGESPVPQSLRDSNPDLPRGLPDPNCLSTAVEPESIEVLADAEMIAALGGSEPSATDGAARPSRPPSIVGGETVDAPASEFRQTPLEVAIVEASAEVAIDPAALVDEEDIDDLQIDIEPMQVIDRRAALPDSAAAAGATITRPSKPGELRPVTDLPSVIVDMGTDIEDLVTRAAGTGPDAEAAAEELLRSGEIGLPSLVRRFPGELAVDWESLSLPVPPAAKHGRLLALVSRFGAASVPYLVPKLHSADRVKRFYAVLLLGEVGETEAFEAIGQRLLDYDARVASLAATVISRSVPLRKVPPSVTRSIRTALTDRQVSDVVQHRAIEAAGVVRDGGAVPALVELLRTARGPSRLAALVSLRTITGQDFGTSARRWSAWWTRARHQKRVEWLIEALDHRQEQVRAVAATELSKLVPNDFGFSATAPRKDRDIARKRYVDWWLAEGRTSFADRD